eukprot:TRINITY_DN7564_c0_g1_i1.p1 TRINITY_DN7564_c0_g1~~TRINITY_DN7564_c0_g1_i1.p1  ORF type:complete len:699 (-),score=172.12 TRINITY_DN7564_c0_g1_i1:78-2174(-)
MTDTPIPPNTYRNLCDKLYDRRKLGATEIETLVKDLNNVKNEEGIKAVIKALTSDFSDSPQGHNKKGGLIGLAAAAIGLGSQAHNYILHLAPPVLRCFTDQDSRVRYYACESLYNIAKVTRGKVLFFFNEIFDGLCKLAADPDPNVKSGAQLLDRLIKDIVTETAVFDMDRFIPLLHERVYVTNPFCRQFLVGWILVLESVPDINLLQYLPKFLDGMFVMLKDQNKDIRAEVDTVLSEFLTELRTAPNVDYGSLVKTVIYHSTSPDDYTRLKALTWVNEFILVGKEHLLPYSAQILSGILPCLSHDVAEIEEAAARANTLLLDVVKSTDQDIPIQAFISSTTAQFLNQWVPTRISALHWVLMLHSKIPKKVTAHMDDLFPALMKTVPDLAEEVVRLGLQLLASISLADLSYFDSILHPVFSLLRSDHQLLQNRGNLIICHLCLFIPPEKIFRRLATLLIQEPDVDFAATMVQTLNLILLTSAECHDVRHSLKNIRSSHRDSVCQQLFEDLYKSWAHSPGSLLSLCLLCQAYEHATLLLTSFADLSMSLSLLLELDKLVQLLESPIFVYLRLQLLEPEKYPHLFKALYGILMILPQSTAFESLRSRLSCISPLGVLHLIPPERFKSQAAQETTQWANNIDFSALLVHFHSIQSLHDAARRLAMKKPGKDATNNNNNNSAKEQLGMGKLSLSPLSPNSPN